MSLDIREIDDGDVPALVALWRICELTKPWNDPQTDIAHARATEHATILLGFDGLALVARLRGQPFYPNGIPTDVLWAGEGKKLWHLLDTVI